MGVVAGPTGCAPVPVQTVEARPSGEYAQVLTFNAVAIEKGSRHVLRVGIDVDPAQLMGWAKPNRAYTVGLDAKLDGPGLGTTQHATLYLPITEQQELSRNEQTGVVQVAYLAAGEQLPNGFKRGALRDAFRFTPLPGEYTLTVEMRTVNNADKRMIKAIRNLRIEVLGPKNGKGALSDWARVP